MNKKIFTKAFYALPVISFLYLLYSANIISNNIAFTHDEVLHCTVAVKMINGESTCPSQEINILGYPVPLVAYGYVGSLKTWIVAPFLKIFGTSPHFIRILNIIFAFTYLLALYWVLVPIVKRKYSLAVFLIPFVDTNFLLCAPMDVGPFLFQQIFISLAIGSLYRYFLKNELPLLWWSYFFVGALLAQKITSMPAVITFIVIIALLSCGKFVGMLKKQGVKSFTFNLLIIPLILLIIPLIPQLIYFFKSRFNDFSTAIGVNENSSYFLTLKNNFIFFANFFNGIDWYQRITFDSDVNSRNLPMLTILGYAGFVLASIVSFFSKENTKRFVFYGILCFFLNFAFFSIFKGLNRLWHYHILTPFFMIAVISSYFFIFDFLIKRYYRLRIQIFAVFFIIVFSCVGITTRNSFYLLNKIEEKKGAVLTSPSLYDVYLKLKRLDVKKIYCINYSLAEPLYLLSKGSLQTIGESLWTQLTPTRINELFDEIKQNKDVCLVYRFSNYKKWDSDFIKRINKEPDIFEVLKKIKDDNEINVIKLQDGRDTDFVIIYHKETS